jgi:tetratricopeptide (TPR) repeat protein
MKQIIMKYTVAIILILLQITACQKKDLLKEKQSTSIIVPTTPGDMQALLDNEDVFGPTTSLNFICADEFYFTDAALSGMKQSVASAYRYQNFSFEPDEEVPDWNNAYTQAYYANNVLAGVKKLRGSIDDKILNPLAGDAYFKRSFAFFNVAQVFALPYNAATAADLPGIPLRLTIDRDEALGRSTIEVTYDTIIGDLWRAVNLLPPTIDQAHRNRSCRPAANALLARVYLSMGAYDSALNAAKRSLAGYDSLLDFNAVIVNTGLLVSATNAETLYQSKMTSKDDELFGAMIKKQVFVESTLLAQYKTGDLRRTVFFTKTPPASFKPGYFGKIEPFTGVGIAELYLIMAECLVREGDVNTGLFYLNKLLKSRWKAGQYNPYTAASPEDALNVILQERRKELVFRGLRYTDVRRLNQTPLSHSLLRTVEGHTYELPPNDFKYALPIPEQVLRFNKLIKQNDY